MKYLRLRSTDPYLNLAIEEYLFDTSRDDVFILWQNSPTVVIGKNQNAHSEINEEYLKKNNILVARRITGGGAVYHDLGNLNYTFISGQRSEGIDFKYFTKPITDALFSLGIKAELSGRNDIMIDDKKISGNAQHTKNGRVLHHGTLLFDSDLSVLSSVLNVDEEKIKAKALKSTRSRVTNIKPFLGSSITVEDFIDKIENFVFESYSPSAINAPSGGRIEELYARNRSSEWLFPKSEFLSTYNIYRKKKYDFGLVSVSLEISSELIKDIKITGDFFGIKEISDLEKMLVGICPSDVKKVISTINVNEYIHRMTSEQLADLIEGI